MRWAALAGAAAAACAARGAQGAAMRLCVQPGEPEPESNSDLDPNLPCVQESEDPNFVFQMDLFPGTADQTRVMWGFADQKVNVKMTAAGGKWLGIGLAGTGGANEMVNGIAIVGSLNGGVNEYNLNGNTVDSLEQIEDSGKVTNADFTDADNVTTLSFTFEGIGATELSLPEESVSGGGGNGFGYGRRLAAAPAQTAGRRALTDATTDRMLFAVGAGPAVDAQHTSFIAMDVDWLDGAVSLGLLYTMRMVHGALMLIAFGFMFPTGTVAAMFKARAVREAEAAKASTTATVAPAAPADEATEEPKDEKKADEAPAAAAAAADDADANDDDKEAKEAPEKTEEELEKERLEKERKERERKEKARKARAAARAKAKAPPAPEPMDPEAYYFMWHVRLQGGAFVLQAIGAIIMYAMNSNHLGSLHEILGTVIVGLCVIQVGLGVTRPPKDNRPAWWNVAHKMAVPAVLLLLGLVNVPLGIIRKNELEGENTGALAVFVGGTVIGAVVLVGGAAKAYSAIEAAPAKDVEAQK